MSKRIATIIAGLVLGACASQSAYTPADSADDYGYYSTALGDDRYRITFNGNSSTGQNTVTDFALLRAAELTSEQGKDWFHIVEQETNTVEKSAPGAGVSHHSAPVVERDCGLLGCTSTVRPSTQTSIGVDTATTRTTYSVSLEIVMGRNPIPKSDGRYYDAETLMQTLWAAM